jgi:C4-type Zn-finger protein
MIFSFLKRKPKEPCRYCGKLARLKQQSIMIPYFGTITSQIKMCKTCAKKVENTLNEQKQDDKTKGQGAITTPQS